MAQGEFTAPAAGLPPALLDGVRDILERRLARLSQRCVDLLTMLAVIGPEVPFEVLVKVADEAGPLPTLLEEAIVARVLAEPATAGPPVYRFTHDLFRETLLAGLSAEQRIRLHLAVGRALESLYAEGGSVHPAELAAHFGAAVTAAPAEAVHYGTLAGAEATARRAFEEARGHYERALPALDLAGDVEPGARIDLLLALGGARNQAGDASAAHRAFRDAADLARRCADPSGLARAAIATHALGWRDSHAESIALLDEAARVLPESPSVLRARVFAALARDLHHTRDTSGQGRAPALAAKAVADARQVDDPSTLAFCLLALHDASWQPGTAESRLAVIEEMLVAATDATDRDMVVQARLLRATAHIELGDPEGVLELERYCRAAEELGHARARYGALSRRATLAVLTGQLAAAEELARQALKLGMSIGEPDALGVYETLMWGRSRAEGAWYSFTALTSNPWPDLPLADAVAQVAAGQHDAARSLLSRLRLKDLPVMPDLEMLTFLAEAIVTAGTASRRLRDAVPLRREPHRGRWVRLLFRRRRPPSRHAGTVARPHGRCPWSFHFRCQVTRSARCPGMGCAEPGGSRCVSAHALRRLRDDSPRRGRLDHRVPRRRSPLA